MYLRLRTLNIFFGIVMLFAMLPFGLSAVCCGLFAASVINFCINAHVAGREIGFGLTKQIRIVTPIILNSTVMGIIIYALQYIIDGSWNQTIIGFALGIITYIGLSIAFQTRTCELLIKFIRKK